MEKQKLIEICRSFSYKHNIGNYSSVDFFCSEKVECKEKNAEKKSEELYRFCREEVQKSLNEYLNENKPKPVKTTKAGQEAINKLKKSIENNPTSIEKAELERAGDWKEKKQAEELQNNN